MKKLPIGIQTFSEIIENNYVYVDKTGIAAELIDRYKYVFLSRPRRFGPVIKIAFSGGNFRSMERLSENLFKILRKNEKHLGITWAAASSDVWFDELIQNASQKFGQPVVILIDEYDKPILDNIDQPEMAALAREELKALYSVIKANDAHIRFAFLTGVPKSSRVSVFSGLNNIEDISLAQNLPPSAAIPRTIWKQCLQSILKARTWIRSSSGMTAILSWAIMCITHLIFCRKQPLPR